MTVHSKTVTLKTINWAETLKSLRKECNLSQEQVAERSGLRREQVSKVEIGYRAKGSPAVETIERYIMGCGHEMVVTFRRAGLGIPERRDRGVGSPVRAPQPPRGSPVTRKQPEPDNMLDRAREVEESAGWLEEPKTAGSVETEWWPTEAEPEAEVKEQVYVAGEYSQGPSPAVESQVRFPKKRAK